MFSYALIIYGLIGALAGILAGLLGISGGVVTIPLLLLVFQLMDFPEPYLMHLVIGTSLASMVFNALSSTLAHNRKHGVLWKQFFGMAPGVLVGCIMGALVAKHLPDSALKIIFGTFACLLSFQFLRSYQAPKEGEDRLPKPWILSCIGIPIGTLSNILGIGGGILTVPTLMAFKVRFKKAVGTSAATSLLISTVGAIAYLYFGKGRTDIPDSVGYLYFPAFIMISITSVITAPYGAKLVHHLPTQVVRRIFAVFLFVTGAAMIFFATKSQIIK